MSCGHVDKYSRELMENRVDTYYKIDWQALKIVPVTLNKDGLDSENYPFDRDAHYTTENEAIMYMKAKRSCT